MDSQPLTSVSESIKQTLISKGLQLQEQIGKGGFASVFKVYSQKYEQTFAVKIFGMNRHDKELESFRREAEIIRNLDHPNIISVYDVFYDSEYAYLVMEYCDGESLYDYVMKNYPLSQAEQSTLMQSIINAVSYCHQKGVVHNDIKPLNILLDKYGRVKLTDFGIAERMKPGEKLSPGRGSLPFMAPETLKGKPYDPFKADAWSLGITFYFVATKSMPWFSTNKDDIKKEILSGSISFSNRVSSFIAQRIRSLLEFNPEKRPDLSSLGNIFPLSPIQKKENRTFPSLVSRTATSTAQLMKLNPRGTKLSSTYALPKIFVPTKSQKKI